MLLVDEELKKSHNLTHTDKTQINLYLSRLGNAIKEQFLARDLAL